MVSFLSYILNDDILSIQQSFQDGVNSIIEMLESLGITPEGSDLDYILKSIKELYNKGKEDGQNDVKNNPGSYGLSGKLIKVGRYSAAIPTGMGAGPTGTTTITLPSSVSGIAKNKNEFACVPASRYGSQTVHNGSLYGVVTLFCTNAYHPIPQSLSGGKLVVSVSGANTWDYDSGITKITVNTQFNLYFLSGGNFYQ